MGLADWLRRGKRADDDEREPEDEAAERDDEGEADGDEEDPTVYPLG